jgi:hypothetical protein
LPELKDEEFRDFVRLVQEAALRAYPNPDRVGCPEPDVIRSIAIQEWPDEHPLFRSHIAQCSPCIAAILEERTRFQADRKKRRRRVFMVSASAAVAASLVAAFLLVASQLKKQAINRAGNTPVQQQRPAGPLAGPGQASRTPVEVALDIRSTSPTRSVDNTAAPVFPLPAALAKLDLTLPMGSKDGLYEVAIESSDGRKILGAQGNAIGVLASLPTMPTTITGNTVLQVVLDLSELPAGEYSLSYHQPNAAPHRISVSINK